MNIIKQFVNWLDKHKSKRRLIIEDYVLSTSDKEKEQLVKDYKNNGGFV